ncbi:hypothetical protein M405DRAFT_939185, partial [Rhizopogon salebrosus TDB-379]
MSSPHPSTKAQPSTEEANGVMKELLATVANLIPHALDFQASAMENHPEALASRWQLTKRIATSMPTQRTDHGAAPPSTYPVTAADPRHIPAAQPPQAVPPRSMPSSPSHGTSTPIGPTVENPSKKYGIFVRGTKSGDRDLGKKRTRQSSSPPAAATRKKQKSTHGPEPKAKSLPKWQPIVALKLSRKPMSKELLTDTGSSSEDERTDENVPQKQMSSKWMDVSDNDGDIPAHSATETGASNVASDDMDVDNANPGADMRLIWRSRDLLHARGRNRNKSKRRAR